jgi:Uncharacterised nucleotidyltransferase
MRWSEAVSNEAKDQEKAASVFRETIAHLEDGSVDYAVGGGLSTDHWTSGAKRISDIDLVIRADDAPDVLLRLSEAGYDTAEMEHSWLHKAHKDGVTIDLMFELKNGTTFDEPLKEHRKRADMFGATAYVIACEDQLASLAATVGRDTIGKHWYRMIDIMANNDLEWDYVLARSEHIPFRMLSVIYFALSQRVPVQKGVIETLMQLASASGHSSRLA